MVMEVSPSHPSNAESPILTTEAGIVSDTNLKQDANVLSPREVTEDGRAREVSP